MNARELEDFINARCGSPTAIATNYYRHYWNAKPGEYHITTPHNLHKMVVMKCDFCHSEVRQFMACYAYMDGSYGAYPWKSHYEALIINRK